MYPGSLTAAHRACHPQRPAGRPANGSSQLVPRSFRSFLTADVCPAVTMMDDGGHYDGSLDEDVPSDFSQLPVM